MRRKYLAGFLVYLLVSSACAADRLQAFFYPNPHLSIDGQWLIKDFSSATNSKQSAMITASTVPTELRVRIPDSYVTSPDVVNIYLVVPRNVAGIHGVNGFLVSWDTQGVFRSGSAIPGDRVLLYQGPVTTTIISDLVTFKFLLDAQEMIGGVRFEPRYEIEKK